MCIYIYIYLYITHPYNQLPNVLVEITMFSARCLLRLAAIEGALRRHLRERQLRLAGHRPEIWAGKSLECWDIRTLYRYA